MKVGVPWMRIHGAINAIKKIVKNCSPDHKKVKQLCTFWTTQQNPFSFLFFLLCVCVKILSGSDTQVNKPNSSQPEQGEKYINENRDRIWMHFFTVGELHNCTLTTQLF